MSPPHVAQYRRRWAALSPDPPTLAHYGETQARLKKAGFVSSREEEGRLVPVSYARQPGLSFRVGSFGRWLRTSITSPIPVHAPRFSTEIGG